MKTQLREENARVYLTITGRCIPLSDLTDAEFAFLEQVAIKYNPRQDWTRFAAWWNAKFQSSGLSASSIAYRICQDLEARLGIDQGKLSLPDYRDVLVDMIDVQFASRQEFCAAAQIDPGQLSRVLAGRGDLSVKLLQKAVEVLKAHLVILPDVPLRSGTSIDNAAEAIANFIRLRNERKRPGDHPTPVGCAASSSVTTRAS